MAKSDDFSRKMKLVAMQSERAAMHFESLEPRAPSTGIPSASRDAYFNREDR